MRILCVANKKMQKPSGYENKTWSARGIHIVQSKSTLLLKEGGLDSLNSHTLQFGSVSYMITLKSYLKQEEGGRNFRPPITSKQAISMSSLIKTPPNQHMARSELPTSSLQNKPFQRVTIMKTPKSTHGEVGTSDLPSLQKQPFQRVTIIKTPQNNTWRGWNF